MLEARKPSTELRDLLHQVIVEVRSGKVVRQVFGHMYHEIGNMFATYQERSWITQVGINLENWRGVEGTVDTEQIASNVPFNSVLLSLFAV